MPKNAISAFAFCAALFAMPALADATIGQPAPAFVAKTLDGKDFDASALKGKVVVINFWATWCTPCIYELPALEAVYRQYHGKGLEVLAISADLPRARSEVDQVMRYFSFPAAMTSSISKNDFGALDTVPVTYIIGKSGTVDSILTPNTEVLTELGLGDKVKSLLEEKPDAPKADKEDNKDASAEQPKP